jgi:Flp pilus assembly protein TadD
MQKGNVSAWLGRGNALLDLGRKTEAIAAFDKVLSLSPDSAEAWFKKGHILDSMRHTVKARECYQKAVTLEPVYQDILNAKLKRREQAVAPRHSFASEIKQPDEEE